MADVEDDNKEEEVMRNDVDIEAADANDEGEDHAAEEEVDVRDEGDDGEGVKADDGKQEAAPVKLGFKTFTSGGDACAYFKNIMSSAAKGVNLNEYEYRCLLDLLQLGHPDASKKVGCSSTQAHS